ncbi:hypothetical protein K5X82_13420 [Halosquirtibacter xylanolyticus]|uniref:hypothetical protein n=1 Tax=Halosquirtibacter xylanolyticus TaxID=3374599 RepID=UPI0037491132|nr:hypothetical protein K5X82_13420 [Prolixibacteraceae bacterium]
MQIRLINNNNINRDSWDNTIDNSNISSPCLKSWYLDKMFPDWEAIVDENYTMIMPILHPMSIDHFYPYGGIISTNPVYSEHLDQFTEKIPKRISSIKLNPTNWWLKKGDIYNVNTKQISLEYAQEEILSRFKDDVIIDRDHLNGQILEIKNIKTIITYLRKSIKTEYNEEELFTRIENIIKFAISNNEGIAIGYINSNNELSSLVILLFNQNFIHLFLAISYSDIDKHQLYQIVAEFIKENDMSNTIIDIPSSMNRFVQLSPELIGAFNIRYQKLVE